MYYFFGRIFEKVRQYFGAQSESIPMSFVLGFYVSLIVKRWWEQYKLLPWPDTLALFISAGIPGAVSTINYCNQHCVIFIIYILTPYMFSYTVLCTLFTFEGIFHNVNIHNMYVGCRCKEDHLNQAKNRRTL